MGFVPCRRDPDIWLHDTSAHFESGCTHVDDLLAIISNPDALFKELDTKWEVTFFMILIILWYGELGPT